MVATESDLPLIIELAREAHEGSIWEGFAAFDPESCEKSVRALMAREEAAVFVSARGVLMLARFPVWFNHGVPITNEVFFYATEGGDALRREGERWAKGLITMSRHETTDSRLDLLYRRSGYVPIEHTFIRRA